MEAWPSQFQTKLNADNFDYQIGDTRIESDVDAGPTKVRSRYTDGVDQYTCSIDIGFSDVAVLKNFWKVTLSNGTRTFAYNDPFSGTPAEFRFASAPRVSPLGRGGIKFRVSMSWIRMP